MFFNRFVCPGCFDGRLHDKTFLHMLFPILLALNCGLAHRDSPKCVARLLYARLKVIPKLDFVRSEIK